MEPAKADAGEPGPLFAQVAFNIVRSASLSDEDANQVGYNLCPLPEMKLTFSELASQIEAEGGVNCSPEPTPGRIPLKGISHIISTTSDFPDYAAAGDALIPVVKPEWVTASLSKKRLANPRQYSPDPRLFFSGVTVCCTDLPSGDKDAIIGGVLAMGGLYSGHVTRMVTHIVALTEENDKCDFVLNKKLQCKIVLPHWFDDCLKLGKRIDERPYLLPNPEILRKAPEEPLRVLENADLHGASTIKAGSLPSPVGSPSPQRQELKVFQGKKVMMSQDLEVGPRLRGTIEGLIASGGGQITGSVYNADIFVCHYREGEEYQIASRKGKDVGNLPWLYHLLTHNKWTSPMRRLLHYPVPRTSLPGFEDYRISLSNYNGEARIYLENLVIAAGGEFTKTMKQDNTHLITAHMVSEKCAAAKEWNINIINHLWLEESYAKWQVQSLTNPRYSHFPARTNLGEVVGQTQISRQAIEAVFFPPDADTSKEEVDERSTDALTRTMSASNLASNGVPKSSNSTKTRHTEITTGPLVDGQTPKASKSKKGHEKPFKAPTPSTPHFIPGGKENETPSTTSSRGAKDRAVAKLHDLAPDIALYEKERKRVGGVIFGGRRTSEPPASDMGRKRSLSRDEGDAVGPEEGRDPKRAKKTRPAPVMKLLLSSYQRWVGQPKREDEERRRLRDLGILIVQDPATCTHVAAPSMVRTQKFVCAVANAPIIITADFVNSCLENNQLQSPDDFLMNDLDTEKRLGFKLQDALHRAKMNKHRLLAGQTIYCTQSVHGGFETYKAIIEANGGSCLMYRARSGTVISSKSTSIDDDDDDEKKQEDFVYLISGTTAEEKKLWSKFRSAVQEKDMKPRIVRTDWMLNLAMSQEMRWDDSFELSEKE
ncbi:MAG: hypothetical protein M1836_003107 [Candelina mexicana]|nr:MAG: hypothetical protein M1836_003107 [Candelina mexicana]